MQKNSLLFWKKREKISAFQQEQSNALIMWLTARYILVLLQLKGCLWYTEHMQGLSETLECDHYFLLCHWFEWSQLCLNKPTQQRGPLSWRCFLCIKADSRLSTAAAHSCHMWLWSPQVIRIWVRGKAQSWARAPFSWISSVTRHVPSCHVMRIGKKMGEQEIHFILTNGHVANFS